MKKFLVLLALAALPAAAQYTHSIGFSGYTWVLGLFTSSDDPAEDQRELDNLIRFTQPSVP